MSKQVLADAFVLSVEIKTGQFVEAATAERFVYHLLREGKYSLKRKGKHADVYRTKIKKVTTLFPVLQKASNLIDPHYLAKKLNLCTGAIMSYVARKLLTPAPREAKAGRGNKLYIVKDALFIHFITHYRRSHPVLVKDLLKSLREKVVS